MKLWKFAVALLLAVIATVVLAQGSHQVSLAWVLSTDDTTAGCASPNVCSQNIYRAPSVCTATPLNLTKYASTTATATTFTDTTPLFGNSCYAATFVINGVESLDSNTAGVSLQPASQTGFSATHN
jgi:hypothetical protein